MTAGQAVIPVSGYTCAALHSSGDSSKTIFLPVVALSPSGSYGAYVAAVIDHRGNLTPVTDLGRQYRIFARTDSL